MEEEEQRQHGGCRMVSASRVKQWLVGPAEPCDVWAAYWVHARKGASTSTGW